MSKIVAMNYKWTMKAISRTEAIPFTITQISCYICAGAEVKGRAGLPGGVKWIRKTIGTTTVCTKNVICGGQRECPHSNQAHELYWRRENRVTRVVLNKDFPEHSIWRHKLRVINTRLATPRNRLHNIAKQRDDCHALIIMNITQRYKIFPVWSQFSKMFYNPTSRLNNLHKGSQ